VVVVVLGSIGARHLDHVPGVGPVALPVLHSLRARSTEFLHHRASSGFAAGALAALLTGQTAERHGVFDPDARMAAAVVHVGSAARDAGVIGAFFTGHPATARAFGFDRGWQHYVSHLPGDGSSFAAPFEDAAQFLGGLRGKKGARFLVVVHARGSHPPWDVTPEELRHLPPNNYGGAIDHRAAGAIVARSRRERGPRLSDDDRTRLWALFAHGLASHDAACGRLIAALRSAGLEGNTTFIVTGDVAASEASPAPFAEGEPVDELALSVPLFIAWPPSMAAQAGAAVAPSGVRPLKTVRIPTDGTDVATTVLATLGLAPPRDFLGADLRAVALGSRPWPRALFVRGSQKDFLRWGPFVLVGSVAHHGGVSRDTKLCDTQLEPACLADVQSSYPIAFDAMRRKAASIVAMRRSVPSVVREPASVDHDTGVALRAWGR
jgi:arylsulfatase A-like enzyme